MTTQIIKKHKGGEEASRECPICHSKRIWKDGVRETRGGDNQRFVCRNCAYRFSESSVLSMESSNTGTRQICVSQSAAKNLATATETKTVAGEIGKTQQDAKGKILEYAWKMKKQGQAESTIKSRIYRLGRLVQKGAELMNPDSVETVLATEKWTQANKRFFVMAYLSFARAFNIAWKPIKTHYEPKQAFIPLEKEIDALISGCGKITGTFLQVLKDTGARAGGRLQTKMD